MTSTSSVFCKAKRSCFAVFGYLLLAAILVGCDAPGTARLKELCETEGFPKVYQQVSAEGYYDDINECSYALRFLVGWDYDFIECKQNGKNSDGFQQSGVYRISKVSQEHGLCDQAVFRTMEKQPVRYKKFLDSGMCFSVKSVDRLTSAYGLFKGQSRVIDLENLFGSKIAKRTMYILRMDNDEMVAEDSSFSLYPTPEFTISSFRRMLHCNTVVPENREVPPLNQVDAYIKPKLTNRESSHGNNRGNLSGSVAR